jgi:LPS-assembly lipoprotein
MKIDAVQLRQTAVFLAVAFGVLGCGFEPVYGGREGRQRVEALANFTVLPIADRSGQVLRNYLIDSMGPTGSSGARKYQLQVRINESPQVLALRRDEVISRSGYAASATFQVIDRSGRSLYTGSAAYSSDFEISDSERATYVSRENARDRVMQSIAEDIKLQLAERLDAIERAAAIKGGQPAR